MIYIRLFQVLAHVPCVFILYLSSSIKHFLIIACQISNLTHSITQQFPSVSTHLLNRVDVLGTTLGVTGHQAE